MNGLRISFYSAVFFSSGNEVVWLGT